nr:TlyA family RNA methyltransferase [Cellulomonas sp. HZM]
MRRGLARSRGRASELIAQGRVEVAGHRAARPAVRVHEDDRIEVRAQEDEYASRGAHKLVGALDATALDVAGRRCLDAGASTGGFTDVLLRRGAASVVAVDVGHDQIVRRLRDDDRVEVREGVNVRDLRRGDVQPAPSLVVADLSFISLGLVLPALVEVAADDADLLVMVKPQFEVGRERLGTGGVVRDPALREAAVLGVARTAAELGLGVRTVVVSPLPGPSGNVEYFLWLRGGPGVIADDGALAEAVRRAVAQTPGGAE